jgi:uncharacterized protein (UPF0548 family)
MLTPLRPTADVIARFRRAQLDAPFGYPEVGATRNPVPPGGYAIDRSDVVIGAGDECFARARDAMKAWRHFESQNGVVRVVPPVPAVEPGAVVVLLARPVGLWSLSACRVVYVEDEPRRFAYAYGTLEHAVRGEELFELQLEADGNVHFRLYAFSRPAHPLVRLGAPIARRLQHRAAREYGEALRTPS